MTGVATAKISSKGQITIPKSMRKEIGVKEGDTIAIISEDKSKTIVLMKSEKIINSIKKMKK